MPIIAIEIFTIRNSACSSKNPRLTEQEQTEFSARQLYGITYNKPPDENVRRSGYPVNPASYGRMAHPLRLSVTACCPESPTEEGFMAKGFILWLLGVPFGLIVLLWLFGFLAAEASGS
jgi:hypothetical protein